MVPYLASLTSKMTSTMLSCSFSCRSALAIWPGYHWTSLCRRALEVKWTVSTDLCCGWENGDELGAHLLLERRIGRPFRRCCQLRNRIGAGGLRNPLAVGCKVKAEEEDGE